MGREREGRQKVLGALFLSLSPLSLPLLPLALPSTLAFSLALNIIAG